MNLWITDDASMDSTAAAAGSGGLRVYHTAATSAMSFRDFNSNTAKVMQFLRDAGSEDTVVPYAANRVVIFQSDLFHATDGTPFRADRYTDHRINLTYLFGKRVRNAGGGQGGDDACGKRTGTRGHWKETDTDR